MGNLGRKPVNSVGCWSILPADFGPENAMKQRKKPNLTSSASADEKSVKSADSSKKSTGSAVVAGDIAMPSDRVRAAISIWLPIHLFALLVSVSAVVEPSSIHARLHSLLRPYLQLTHFGVDDRPLYLAYGDSSEQAHRLEVTDAEIQQSDANVEWTNPHFRSSDDSRLTIVGGLAAQPGLAVSDRYSRWLSTAATLAESDQPSLVAELLLPVLPQDGSIRGVRIVRRVTDLNTTLDDNLPPPYAARISTVAGRTSLIRLQETRLNAIADDSESEVNE